MARQIERLSARAVSAAKEPGMYPDGAGLYLRIGPSGSKAWVYRYTVAGRAHDIGLGPLHLVSLAQAREKARGHGRTKLEGNDPLSAKRSLRASQRLTEAKAITFRQCAERYIDAHSAGWKGGKQLAEWNSTLSRFAYPTIGSLPVQTVDVGLVMQCVEPLWTEKTTTASRVRQRIEAVLDCATARGYRQGDNPARWKGLLDSLLPMPRKVQPIEHHPALPYGEVAGFMTALRGHDSVGARALEFAILTAARSGEVLGARWDEIDLQQRLWTVPGSRMKAGKEHRVPLSDAALVVLEAMPRLSDLVFPGRSGNSPMSKATPFNLLRAMGRGDLTMHGFRSTFRDWAAERTNFPTEAAEMALAHTVGDKVEAAYRRGDMFDKRRQLMDAWARFCDMPAAGGGEKVIAIGSTR